MKVLVTGAAGFIGSRVCEMLLERGHQVLGVDSLGSDLYPGSVKIDRLQKMRITGEFEFVQLDLCQHEIDPMLESVEVVVNEAAVPGLERSWTEYQTYVDANMTAVYRLLAALSARRGVYFLQASTSSVYGATAIGDELQPTNPTSPYGVTKLGAEKLIGAYRQSHGQRAGILRYFSVYGPSQRPDMAFSIICRKLLDGLPIEICGDGQQSRSNTFVDDVARATCLAAERSVDGLVANIAGLEQISLLDAIKVLADSLGVKPELVFGQTRMGDQRATRGDSSLALRVLGWQPTVDMREGLRKQAFAALEDHSGQQPQGLSENRCN